MRERCHWPKLASAKAVPRESKLLEVRIVFCGIQHSFEIAHHFDGLRHQALPFAPKFALEARRNLVVPFAPAVVPARLER